MSDDLVLFRDLIAELKSRRSVVPPEEDSEVPMPTCMDGGAEADKVL